MPQGLGAAACDRSRPPAPSPSRGLRQRSRMSSLVKPKTRNTQTETGAGSGVGAEQSRSVELGVCLLHARFHDVNLETQRTQRKKRTRRVSDEIAPSPCSLDFVFSALSLFQRSVVQG